VPLTAAALAEAPPAPNLASPLPAAQIGPRIFDRFLAACRERPEATAIVHPGGSWTYAQVERMTGALAARLRALPGQDDVVALYGQRCGELVIAMLACARAGLTFAVLDAGYPAERIQLLLGVLQPGRFVAIGDAAGPALGQLSLPPSVLRFDSALASTLAADDAARDGLDAVRPEAIAYLLFTSGTTGVPKCIATSHTPLVHFISWYEHRFAVDPACRFSMLSGLSHDPVLRDVFVPLSAGAELHIPAPPVVLDPVKLHGWFADHRITHAHVTPQLLRILCAGRRDRSLSALRFVFSGGDMLRTKQATELLATAPSARVINFYGATETPQAMGFHVFDPQADTGDAVPIGRGIDEVQLFVLSTDKLEALGPGARGQIAIRTRYLSAGYRGDPGLTNAKFIANPQSSDPTDRLYLTGDVGHRRPDGAVILEGRVDDQVKIRGFRVELGDVAHQLHQLPQIKEAVVLAERTPDGEARLVAYVVPTGAADATAAVRDAMTAAVPAYLVPARFVWLERFPLLPNGKIDRAQLRQLEPAETAPVQHLDPTERAIADQWRELLGRPSIDVEQSFVTLGGDSLSFIEASVKLELLLGALPDGWEKLSIRQLARTKRAERSAWTRVDASVFLRAISILAVVAGHYELPNLAGSVLALFVVSGMSFGRYLVPQVRQSRTVTPIARLVVRVAVPAILYSIAVNFVFKLPKWPGMLLANNLVSPNAHVSGIGFWYIDVLVQCFVVLGVLLAIPPIRRALSGDDPFYVLLGATLLFVGIAVAAPYVHDLSHLADRTPVQFLRAVFLGWTLLHASTLPRKLLVVALSIPVFGDIAWHHEEYVVFPFVATTFLAFVQRVSLPVMVGRVVTIIASASLFIYLTDHQVGLVLEKAGLGRFPIAMVGVAAVVGIAAWKLWERALSFMPRTIRSWL
jgi:amino acid adenylation domain-containing protein